MTVGVLTNMIVGVLTNDTHQLLEITPTALTALTALTSLTRRLLLTQTMKTAKSPDNIRGIDSHHFPPGKRGLNDLQGLLVPVDRKSVV